MIDDVGRLLVHDDGLGALHFDDAFGAERHLALVERPNAHGDLD